MTPPATPPRLARFLLKRAFHRDDRDCAVSDLDEEFEARASRDGGRAARRWYRDQVRRSVLPALRRRVFIRVALASELRWAWRGVRARGAGALFLAGLVALSVAANAIVFSAADSFVFRRTPYPNVDRLVVLQRTTRSFGVTDYMSAPALLDWRAQRDLFAAVHAHAFSDSIFVTIAGVTEAVRSAEITPGTFEALGVAPRWGRPLQDGDAAPGSPPVAVIGEALARRLFVSAPAAIDRPLESGAESVRIVGVMPAGFHYPSAREEVWRALDVETLAAQPRARNSASIRSLALLPPGLSIRDIAPAMPARTKALMPPDRVRQDEVVAAVPLADAARDPRTTTLFLMLVGAAACLLLIACLNVTSLELAGVVLRARAYAVQAALGASRASLVRTAMLEGALLAGAAAAAALALTYWGTSVLVSALTPAMRDALSNVVDIDLRTLTFMIGATLAAWLLTSLPAVWRAFHPNVLLALGRDTRSSSMSRAGARVRQFLMAAQVALTVLLLVGALLYVRSYVARAKESKGFDSSRLASLQVGQPPNAGLKAIDLQNDLLARLRALPFVKAVSVTWAVPPATGPGIAGALEIDGRSGVQGRVKLAGYRVDPEYFNALGLRRLLGRWFATSDHASKVVVDEAFARRFWPDGGALGGKFHVGTASFGGQDAIVMEIVGIASHVRADRDETETGDEIFVVYNQIPPTSASLTYVVRLGDPAQLAEVAAFTRSVAKGCVVRARLLDERYADLYGDTQMAATVMSGFGILAFVVAMAGVYGVMAFLVAGRTREIGIRMALGADRSKVRRLVLGGAMRFVLAGAAIGVLAAVIVSRSFGAQLFDVSATDPVTFVVVVLAVAATAALATWHPAATASRVDPAKTLRSE